MFLHQKLGWLTFTVSPIPLQLVVLLTLTFVVIVPRVHTLVFTSTIQDRAGIHSLRAKKIDECSVKKKSQSHKAHPLRCSSADLMGLKVFSNLERMINITEFSGNSKYLSQLKLHSCIIVENTWVNAGNWKKKVFNRPVGPMTTSSLFSNDLSILSFLQLNDVPNMNISHVPSGCSKHRHDDTGCKTEWTAGF